VASAITAGYVDAVVVDGKYAWDKRLYQFKCRLKSRIDAKAISNKVDLHLRLATHSSPWICETQLVDRSTCITDGDLWIWRPEDGFAGRGIFIVNTQAALRDAFMQHSGDPRAKRAMISRYIENPCLMDGCKFHLRIHFVVLLSADSVRTFVFRDGLLVRAVKPYQNCEFSDKSVHDTHMDHGAGDFRFPRDYPGGLGAAAAVFLQVQACLRDVSELTAATMRKYDESEVCRTNGEAKQAHTVRFSGYVVVAGVVVVMMAVVVVMVVVVVVLMRIGFGFGIVMVMVIGGGGDGGGGAAMWDGGGGCNDNDGGGSGRKGRRWWWWRGKWGEGEGS